jgi:hypothetical protein
MITLLVACSASDSKSTPSTAAASSAQPGAQPTTCEGYTKGKSGVINVFCGGNAKAKGTIGSAQFVLTGGSCVQGETFMSVNVGVLVGPDFTGQPPDYFGIVLKPTSGPFSNASATIDTIGTPHVVTVSGSLTGDLRGGQFSGSDGSIPITGSFSC